MAGEGQAWDVLARVIEYVEPTDEPSLSREEMRVMLAQLKPRERRVIDLRFGLDADHPLKLQEVADILKRGATRERVRWLEERAIRRMRIMRGKQRSGGDGG